MNIEIKNISLELVKVNYQIGLSATAAQTEKIMFVYFSNGNKVKLGEILSFIGNNKIDTWQNVETIRKSISNTKKIAFLNKHLQSCDKGMLLS